MTRREQIAKAAESSTLSPLTALIVLAIIGSLTFLAWDEKVDGQAYVAIVSGVIGGILHAAGTRGGAQAAVDPPPTA